MRAIRNERAAASAPARLAAQLAWTPPAYARTAAMCAPVANERWTGSHECQSDEICFRFYFNPYCPDWSEPTCLTDPSTGRTICW